jgi:hypothetical protein
VTTVFNLPLGEVSVRVVCASDAIAKSTTTRRREENLFMLEIKGLFVFFFAKGAQNPLET